MTRSTGLLENADQPAPTNSARGGQQMDPRAVDRPGYKMLAAILLVGIAVRLSILLVTHPYQQPLHVEIQHVAISIATGHGFGNPYPVSTGPTALFTPGCPLVLAGIYRFFGSGELAEAVTNCVNAILASAVFALLPLLSWFLGLPLRIGVLAALAGAMFPVYLLNEFRSIQSVTGAFCLVMLSLLAAWTWKNGRALSARLGMATGAAWGLALLFAPNLLLIGVLWMAITLVRLGARALRFAAVVSAVVLAILSPWVIRNEIQLGAPIVTRSNLGLELWIANNDTSGVSYGSNEISHELYQPFINRSEAAQMARVGEATYMHKKMELASDWIERHPQRFAALTAMRVMQFWLPITFRKSQTAILWTLTIAGAIGAFFAWRTNRTAFWLLGSIWLAYPLVYYLVQLDNPYRYPIYWSVLLMAFYGVGCLMEAAARKGPNWLMALTQLTGIQAAR